MIEATQAASAGITAVNHSVSQASVKQWRSLLNRRRAQQREWIERARKEGRPARLALIEIARSCLGDAAVATAVPAYVLEGETRDEEDWAPVWAVKLLLYLRAAEAIPAFIEILEGTDVHYHIYCELSTYLSDMGKALIAPALEALPSLNKGALVPLIDALLELNVKDERVFQGLLRVLEHEVWAGASYLRQYGDPRAVPALEQTLRRALVDASSAKAHEIGLLAAALRSLTGGLLPCDLTDTVERIEREDTKTEY